MVEDLQIDIVLWQDMHFKGDSFPGVPGKWINLTSLDKTSGIIKANSSIDMIQIASYNNSVFAGVETSVGTLTMGSQYSKPSGDLDQNLQDWQNYINTNTFLLGG